MRKNGSRSCATANNRHRRTKSDRQNPAGEDRDNKDGARGQIRDTLHGGIGAGQKYRPALLSAIIKNAPTDFETPTLTGDLFAPGASVVLVAPQDIQAPKGRLILPQVQVIRDILDHKGMALTCTADQLPEMLAALKEPPALVVTDSQVFGRVNALLPREVPLTSFSIIMARSKGELSVFVEGARAIDKLKPTDKVLIAEACTHAPLNEDIGREKLPRWLRERAGEGLVTEIATGLDFPKTSATTR